MRPRVFAIGLLMSLAAPLMAGCCGKRTTVIVRLTEKSGDPLPQVGLRVYPPLRILPSLPETWGATGSDGVAILNVPDGDWRCFFNWKGNFYRFGIMPETLIAGKEEVQESFPETHPSDDRVIDVRLSVRPK